MFDYSIQILQEGKKSKLIMTVDQEIVLEKLYNNYVAASTAAEERLHIDKIANTYFDFAEIDGFSAVADLKTIKANNSKLSIALYVRNSDRISEIPDFDSALETWLSNSSSLHKELNELDKLREGRNQ